MVPIELLLNTEMQFNKKIEVNPHLFWENIDVFLPLAFSENANQSEEFEQAYKIHKEVFQELKGENPEHLDNLGLCAEKYMEAYKNELSKCEAAANLMGLHFLLLNLLKNVPLIWKAKPAILTSYIKMDSNLENILDDNDSEFEESAEELVDAYYEQEQAEELDELIRTLRGSNAWRDLADYYMALKYAWNLVDNGLNLETNILIGEEMMDALLYLGNAYAARRKVLIFSQK